MLKIIFNSKEKAERCISAGIKTHKMDWKEYYNSFSDKTSYIVFYEQKGG